MALIVNLDRGQYIDARNVSSVQELGASTVPMQWLMHLCSSSESGSAWPLGGHWLGSRIWVCKENDQCPKLRAELLELRPDLEHPSMGLSELSVFQLVELACTKINARFQ